MNASPRPRRSQTALRRAHERAVAHLLGQQHEDGCFQGEVAWCAMLAAQYVMVAHLTRQTIAAERRRLLVHYFSREQAADGGWGLHPEGHSTLYVTALVYVALRLLGVEPDDAPCAEARRWLADHPVTHIPTWGKAWLSMLGLYSWDGMHPIPPETWLLPRSAPLHPRRYYCHTRLIYMGFSYLYGVRFTGRVDARIQKIRAELYPRGWEAVDWARHRSSLDAADVHVAPGRLLWALYTGAGVFERLPLGPVRRLALEKVLDRIRFEQDSSQFSGISPVNGMLNTLAMFHAGDRRFERSFEGIDYWAWSDEREGMRIAGATSHTWDSAFVAQTLAGGPDLPGVDGAKERLAGYFDGAQIRENLPGLEANDRLPTLGGWCFGDPTHRWPVSDCTAEALLALRALEPALGRALSDGRIEDAVHFILERHNADGGFGSYERQRGDRILERINPAEMFGGCMTEYSYLECTSSCVQALASVLRHRRHALCPDLAARSQAAVSAGGRFIADAQQDDGAWEGVWGIQYTYGTLFGVRGLLAAGFSREDPAIRRACRWLVEHRLADGGWGEHFRGCAEHRYVPRETSQVIQTAWAVLALLEAGPETAEERAAVDGGIALLLGRQRPDGGWDRESGAGIFFDTAVLNYDLYRLTFPTWALGARLQAPFE